MVGWMSSPSAARRRLILATFAAALASVGVAKADVTLSLTPPAGGPATAPLSSELRFDLLALNDSDASANYAFPAALPCKVTTPTGVVEASATAASAGSAEIAPRSFARRTYVVSLSTVGRVVVELADGSAAGTVLTVAPRDATADRSETSAAPRNPVEAVVQQDPNYKSEMGLVEYLAYRIKPHEPVYVVGGGDDPELKFQFSFKYQVFDPNGPLAQSVPGLDGLHFAYSQTSFWDLDGDSNPFYDTSYRPEGLLSYDNLDNYLVNRDGDRVLPEWLRLGFQAGIKHESNGRDGDASRSVNIVYARPIVTFSGDDGWFVSVAPSVFGYVGDLSDNPDIQDYRGHADLRLVVGRGGGVQLAATGRLGDGVDYGSIQLDLTVPIRKLTFGNFDVYFTTSYFSGYGESLLRYNERDESLRFGFSLVR